VAALALSLSLPHLANGQRYPNHPSRATWGLTKKQCAFDFVPTSDGVQVYRGSFDGIANMYEKAKKLKRLPRLRSFMLSY
jgi:hypothetical protein